MASRIRARNDRPRDCTLRAGQVNAMTWRRQLAAGMPCTCGPSGTGLQVRENDRDPATGFGAFEPTATAALVPKPGTSRSRPARGSARGRRRSAGESAIPVPPSSPVIFGSAAPGIPVPPEAGGTFETVLSVHDLQPAHHGGRPGHPASPAASCQCAPSCAPSATLPTSRKTGRRVGSSASSPAAPRSLLAPLAIPGSVRTGFFMAATANISTPFSAIRTTAICPAASSSRMARTSILALHAVRPHYDDARIAPEMLVRHSGTRGQTLERRARMQRQTLTSGRTRSGGPGKRRTGPATSGSPRSNDGEKPCLPRSPRRICQIWNGCGGCEGGQEDLWAAVMPRASSVGLTNPTWSRVVGPVCHDGEKRARLAWSDRTVAVAFERVAQAVLAGRLLRGREAPPATRVGPIIWPASPPAMRKLSSTPRTED